MNTDPHVRIQEKLKIGNLNVATVYGALFLRLVIFALLQAVIAIIFLLLGHNQAWAQSTRWWIVVATIANAVTILLLQRWYKKENIHFFETIRFNVRTLGKDLLILLGTLIILGPIGFLPISMVAGWLFGNVESANELLIQPLPVMIAAVFGILFPLTIAFAELPLYFGYIMPRIHIITRIKWLSILLPALFLAAQHCTLPLIFDLRFVLWRFLMFLPFSLFLGLVIHWRPRLLPYLMVIHALMDLGTSFYILTLSL